MSAASPVRFATVNFRPDPRAYIEWLRVADGVGFDLIGYGDSQCLWPELYSSLTLAALHTTTAKIGPAVSNPITRHPAVAASGIATVQALSEGRAFYGLSSGDSAVFSVGLRPARMAQLAEHARVVRALCAGEEVTWEGQPLQLHWPTQPVPIYLAAEGPKMLHLAGQIADGVFVSNGLSREVVVDTAERVAAGARSVGRDPADIEIWYLVKFLVAPTEAEGLEAMRFTLAGSANHNFRFTLEGKHVPEHLHQAVRTLQERYAFDEHAQHGGEGRNAALVEELGLTDWLAERFLVTGPAGRCVERLQEIASFGATNLLLTQLVPDPLAAMRQWDEEIFPALR